MTKAILNHLCDKTDYKHKMLSLAVKDNLLEVCIYMCAYVCVCVCVSLLIICVSCDLQGVNLLINMGADVNIYADTDQSPICLAVQNNNHMMILNLLAEVGGVANN